MPLLPTTSLHLDLPLQGNHIRRFRAAIIEATGRKLELLHNKDADGNSVNRYPLVQYRVKNGRAAAWAAGPGCAQLKQWLFESQGRLAMGGHERPFRVTDWKDDQFELKMLPADKPNWYYLNRWLPLHKMKYLDWLKAPNLTQRIAIMENQLAAHLLAFFRDVDWYLPEHMHVNLQQLVHTRKVTFHNTPFVAFDVVFSANVTLPPGLGLGHAVSHGYGIAVPANPIVRPNAFSEKELEQLLAQEVSSI